jgi:hypothetical protein
MKRQAYTLIAMIVLVGSMAIVAQAQTSGRTQLVANIPFEFSVGDKTLPAGRYMVQAVNADSSVAVLKIQSADGKDSAMVRTMTVIGKAQNEAKLIFHRYGNHYFFAQAWVDGETSGLQAPKARAERALQRELAEAKTAVESIAIAARR